MEKRVFSATEDEARFLREMVSNWKKRFQGHAPPPLPDAPTQPGEVYIAKVPTGGIDPIESDAPNEPQKQTCQVYKIVEEEFEQISGFNIDVYNLSTQRVPEGYTFVTQDKFGDWITNNILTVMHSTAVDAIAAGEEGTVNLPDDREVEATNWSDTIDINEGDKIHVYLDPEDGKYYAIKTDSGSTQDGEVTFLVKNITNQDQPAGALLQVGQFATDTSPRVYDAGVPVPPYFHLVIIKEAIIADGIGIAVAAGVVKEAIVYVVHLGQTHAVPAEIVGDTFLDSHDIGPFELLKQPDFLGPQLLPVRYAASPIAHFELFDSITPGIPLGDQASAKPLIWNLITEEWEVVNRTYVVHDFVGARGIPNGARVIVEWDPWSNQLHIIEAPLPDEFFFIADGTKARGDDSVNAIVDKVLSGSLETGEAVVVWDPDPNSTNGFETEPGTFGRATQGHDGKRYIDWAKCVA